MVIRLHRMCVRRQKCLNQLYPVLNTLQKDGCLEVYDRQYDGRNRRYYKVTLAGREKLDMYRTEWTQYMNKINQLFAGGEK